MNLLQKLFHLAKRKPPSKITAQKFLAMIAENPSVFKHWETPLEITEYVNCQDSPITHLSKYLTFSGKNERGDAAYFLRCPNLETATGTFDGHLSILGSGIQYIENLTITQPDKYGNAAEFTHCKNLQVATGTYPGFVRFESSGIGRIKNLVITQPDNSGNAANFEDCRNLKVATGTYPGWVDFSYSQIERIENLVVTQSNKSGYAANFWKCRHLKMASGTYAGRVVFDNSGIKHIKNLFAKSAAFHDCSHLQNLKEWEDQQEEFKRVKIFVKENKPKELPFL
jgi:hypothetical protein